MLTLHPELAQRLRDLSVRMEITDRNTVLLRQVPTHAERFNRPQTSLLVKRPQSGLPYVVSVSAELEYRGTDPRVAAAFRSGIPQSGWRTLLLTLPQTLDPAAAVNEALAVIGFDGAEPRIPDGDSQSDEDSRPSLLEEYGVDLSAPNEEGFHARTFGRDDEILDVLATVLSERECRLPLIVGPSGCGKTNLLHAVAARLRSVQPERRVVAINPNELVVGVTFEGEFENVFHELLQEAEGTPGLILAVEHFEMLLLSRLPRLLSEFLDRGRLSIVGTLLPAFANRIRVPLARRVRQVRLPELESTHLRAALKQEAARLAAKRGMTIEPSMVDVCMRAAAHLPGVSPARELALLEASVVRAGLNGVEGLSADDLLHAAHRMEDLTSDE